MITDLFQSLRNWWRATLKPAWQNLLSQKSNTAMTFSVMLLLEILLCLLFIAHANNQAAADSMKLELKAYELITSGEFKAQTAPTMQRLYTNLSAMRRMNSLVFVFATAVWFAVSSFIFSKLIISSMELRKYIYGLYITFGANTGKIRRLIFAQMMTLGLGALILALPIALLLSGRIYGFVALENLSALEILTVLLLVAGFLIAVISSVAASVTAKTCVSLLAAADVSNYVSSPRRSKRHIYINRSWGLARISLRRMRRHYVPLVISAVLPACLFFCCMSLASSNDQRKQETVQEYTLHLPNGITAADYEATIAPALEAINGISATTPSGSGGLGSSGAHLLLPTVSPAGNPDLTAVFAGDAYDGIKIVSGDRYSLNAYRLHPAGAIKYDSADFEIPVPAEGYATMVYPKTVWGSYPDDYTPIFSLGSGTLYFTYADSNAAALSLAEKVNTSNGLGFSLCANPALIANDRYDTSGLPPKNEFIEQRLSEELLVLNPADFQRLTGIDVKANEKRGLATPAVTLSELGCFLVTNEGYSESLPSVPFSGFSAASDLIADVADPHAPAKYGLDPSVSLSDRSGKATLILSPNSKLPSTVSLLYLSGRSDVSQNLPTESTLYLSSSEVLQLSTANHPQSYTAFAVDQVLYSSTLTTDVLLLPEADIAALFGRDAAYSEIKLTVPVDTEASSIVGLLSELYGWMQSPELRAAEPTLTEAGLLWQAITVEMGKYSETARMLAGLLLLSIPFIWFAPQYNHYQKRRSDMETLCLLGQRRSRAFKILICEGLLLALMSALVTVILCPLFTVVTFEFLKFSGFPFAYSSLDIRALILVTAFSAVCAFLFTVINYAFLFPRRIKRNANVFEKE